MRLAPLEESGLSEAAANEVHTENLGDWLRYFGRLPDDED
jgi:hypothetical protein